MADYRDATIAAFAGMENSIRSLRYLMLILAQMDQNRTVSRSEDGTAFQHFDSLDELNAQCFLILQAEERMAALVEEFDGCLEVLGKGKEAAHGKG